MDTNPPHELVEIGSDGCCTTWACAGDRCAFLAVTRTTVSGDGHTKLARQILNAGDGSPHNGQTDLTIDLIRVGPPASAVLDAAGRAVQRSTLDLLQRVRRRLRRAAAAEDGSR
jgi:hypothetical protein